MKTTITKNSTSEAPVTLDGSNRTPKYPKVFTSSKEPDKPNFKPMYVRKLEEALSNENTDNIEPIELVQDGLSQLRSDQQLLESQTRPYSTFNPISDVSEIIEVDEASSISNLEVLSPQLIVFSPLVTIFGTSLVQGLAISIAFYGSQRYLFPWLESLFTKKKIKLMVNFKKESLKYLLTLSKNNPNELMYLLKTNNFLLNSRKQEI